MNPTTTPGTQVVAGELHRIRRGREKRFSAEAPSEPCRRPARVAVTLALAHTIQRAIDRGEIRDQAEAARGLGVTRARMTQMLDLTLLAPDLQEAILFRTSSDSRESFHERAVRTVSQLRSWAEQRGVFAPLRASPLERILPRSQENAP